jgi:hypothetical protein
VTAEALAEAPKPPRPLAYGAVALELAMLATFSTNRSVLGVLLWLGYFWFSATWALLFDLYGD